MVSADRWLRGPLMTKRRIASAFVPAPDRFPLPLGGRRASCRIFHPSRPEGQAPTRRPSAARQLRAAASAGAGRWRRSEHCAVVQRNFPDYRLLTLAETRHALTSTSWRRLWRAGPAACRPGSRQASTNSGSRLSQRKRLAQQAVIGSSGLSAAWSALGRIARPDLSRCLWT
jgi:hypothetical protein